MRAGLGVREEDMEGTEVYTYQREIQHAEHSKHLPGISKILNPPPKENTCFAIEQVD